jgi:hypothetical protein
MSVSVMLISQLIAIVNPGKFNLLSLRLESDFNINYINGLALHSESFLYRNVFVSLLFIIAVSIEDEKGKFWFWKINTVNDFWMDLRVQFTEFSNIVESDSSSAA